MDEITLRRVSDYHVHFRQDELLPFLAEESGRYCGRVLAMPNTVPAITTAAQLVDYRNDLRRHMPATDVLCTCELRPDTTADDVATWHRAGAVAAKMYPRHGTTNSENGFDRLTLTDPHRHPGFLAALGALTELGMVLCLHGELPGSPCLEAESDFLPFVRWLVSRYARLRVVLEHITTADAVDFIHSRGRDGLLAGTVTAHHLWLTLEDVLADPHNGGRLNVHNYCKPVAKTVRDRKVLRGVVLEEGHPRFFLGSDSAPHDRAAKEGNGCAGVYTAPVLLPVLAQLFEAAGRAGRLQDFTSGHGDAFYGLGSTAGTVHLVRDQWTVPHAYQYGDVRVIPFRAGWKLDWRLE